jgi:hypothetical protein
MTMAGKYFVDWTDPPFPAIRPIGDASSYAEPMTLAEAKQDIISSFQGQLEHARDQIRRTRSLKVADIKAEAERGW